MQRLDSHGHPGAASPAEKACAELPAEVAECLIRSLKKHWHCYRQHLRKCQRKVSAPAVHDLRTEARRLISLLQLLSPFASAESVKRAEACLQKHLDVFDDLRDTQVQLTTLSRLVKKSGAASEFQRVLKKHEHQLKPQTLKHAKALRCKKLAKLVRTCRREAKGWLSHAGPKRANRVLLFTLQRAFDAAAELQDRIDRKDTRSIHCTRIAFKEFRYMVEAMADHWPWVSQQLLANMRRYQKLMGYIQDAEVFREAFAKFECKESADPVSARQFSNKLLRTRDQLIARYLASADRLWTFRPPTGDDSPSQPHSRASKPK